MSNAGRPKQGRKVTGSVIAGLLLVPATAIAAVAIVGATSSETTDEAFDEGATITVEVEAELASMDADSSDDDLSDLEKEACEGGAEELIEREADGTITDLEAAALDALREICDEAGMTLEGPPQPDPVVQVVTVVNDSPDSSDGTHHDDDSEGEHEDDDDDHEDDEDDEDDEDEDDEDDDDEDDD